MAPVPLARPIPEPDMMASGIIHAHEKDMQKFVRVAAEVRQFEQSVLNLNLDRTKLTPTQQEDRIEKAWEAAKVTLGPAAAADARKSYDKLREERSEHYTALAHAYSKAVEKYRITESDEPCYSREFDAVLERAVDAYQRDEAERRSPGRTPVPPGKAPVPKGPVVPSRP
jgi:hypothetical protein